MRRLTHNLPLLLAALFWMAQLQGTWHGITHVHEAPVVVDHGVPGHVMACMECAALAQAGAAPLSAVPSVAAFVAAADLFVQPAATASAGRSPSFYRSRAPPTTPV